MSLRDYAGLGIEDLTDPDLAVNYLSLLLKRQELTLLLGTGVSAGAKLPNWRELVERCETAVGIASPDVERRPSDELMRAIDQVRRTVDKDGTGRTVRDLVRDGLYRDFLADGAYPLDTMSDRMLVALGALVMASARGSVGEVFTLNFDDLLEWYLNLHGFTTQVIYDFPCRVSGDVDVTIYHPHGFLPLMNDVYEGSDWLVFAQSELRSRLAAPADDPWPVLLTSRFLAKRFLAVGTSMNDLDIDVHLDRARRSSNPDEPIGFVLDVDISEDRRADMTERGVVPVSLRDYDELPDFLLSVCRAAAASRAL